MPMKRDAFGRKAVERWRPIVEMNRHPSNLLLRILHDFTPDDIRDELRSKTHAEHCLFGSDCFRDEAFFRNQPGMVAMLVNVHRATHDDQQIEVREFGQRLIQVEACHSEVMITGNRPIADSAGAFDRAVFETMDLHVWWLPDSYCVSFSS